MTNIQLHLCTAVTTSPSSLSLSSLSSWLVVVIAVVVVATTSGEVIVVVAVEASSILEKMPFLSCASVTHHCPPTHTHSHSFTPSLCLSVSFSLFSVSLSLALSLLRVVSVLSKKTPESTVSKEASTE